MGTWIELRCESSRTTDGIFREGCFSFRNEGPMGMADDTLSSVTRALRYLDKRARMQGWVKLRSGWWCPHCAKLRLAAA